MFSSTKILMAQKPPYGKLYAWGDNGWGQLGLGGNSPKKLSTPTQVGSEDWLSVAAGGGHTVAIRSDGKLYGWGDNLYFQLGFGDDIVPFLFGSKSPIEIGQIGSEKWRFVTAGTHHTLAIRDSDGSLFAWGGNYAGQVGDGSDPSQIVNTKKLPVMIRQGFPGNEMENAAAGDRHSLASRWSSFEAWGWAGLGQLGIGAGSAPNVGPEVNKNSPVSVSLPGRVKALSCGEFHSAAVTTDGDLYAWGYNALGQLGDGTTTNRPSPVKIGTATWRAVSCGWDHTVGIRNDGKLFVWGWRQGPGSKITGPISGPNGEDLSLSPRQLGTESWLKVACGYGHSLAIREDGLLFAWGDNSCGQLGDGTTANRYLDEGGEPVQVGTERWKHVACGKNVGGTSFAIKSP